MNTQEQKQQLSLSLYKELLMRSRSSNGYVRESAIIALEQFPTEKTIESLIERVNDWVPAIRQLARHVLKRICVPETIPFFINKLYELYHLKECNRDNHSKFVDDIEELIIKHSDNAIFYLSSCNSSTALLYAKLLKRREVICLSKLANTCSEHSVAKVRHYSVVLSSKLDNHQRLVLLKHLIEDKSGLVRRDALRSLIKYSPDLSNSMSVKLLYDREKSVREQALLYLNSNEFNCQVEFTKKLTSTSIHQQRVAIWGLTELFVKHAVDNIVPFLDSPYPSVRALAVRACFILAEEKDLERLLKKILTDTSPRVVKECFRLYDRCFFRIEKTHLKKSLAGNLK